MYRVRIALLGVAIAFAALVLTLDLGRADGGSTRAALGTFAGVLLLGLPALQLCCQRGWWQIWRLMAIGALGGALASLPFAGGNFVFNFLALIFVLTGALLGLLFWCMAIWRNNDLTCPKTFCLPGGTSYRVARKWLQRRNLG